LGCWDSVEFVITWCQMVSERAGWPEWIRGHWPWCRCYDGFWWLRHLKEVSAASCDILCWFVAAEDILWLCAPGYQDSFRHNRSVCYRCLIMSVQWWLMLERLDSVMNCDLVARRWSFEKHFIFEKYDNDCLRVAPQMWLAVFHWSLNCHN
jgi:hypothetical protein